MYLILNVHNQLIFVMFNILFYFQTSMDLPPDKAKLLKNYDYEKKWDIICDQVSRNVS